MKRISSQLTFVFKYIIPGVWALILLFLAVIALIGLHFMAFLFILILFLPMVNLIKLNWIRFDDYFVFISNGRRQCIYELNQIKSINEPNGIWDPFFELEIYEKNGEVSKFDFMPQDQFVYKITGKYTGTLLELSERIREVKAQRIS